MPKLTVTLADGSTRELPEGFPTTQGELDQIISNRLGPKSQRITELESQVAGLTSERDAAVAQVTEKDARIGQLETDVTEKDRSLLVTEVAHAKGVPAKWLRGDDQSALEASADEWLADAQGLSGGGAGQSSTNGGGEGEQNGQGQAGGYVGSAGTGGEEPARLSFDEAKQAAYERARKQRKGALA